MKKVKLDHIRIDGDTQSREVIDQPTVYQYLEDMKEGDEFPRMFAMFDGATYWLVDGFHRYHAYKLLGIKDVEIDYKPGTMEEAQVLSYGMNAKHGKPRTAADKRKSVEQALKNPLTKGKSNYEIAKICHVSQPFVASIRDPEVKKKQQEHRENNIKKTAEKIEQNTQDTNQISNTEVSNPHDGAEPDADEIKAAELAMQADQDAMYKLLESDDALATAHEEIKRLNHLNAQMEIRLHGLMTERNEAVKMVKKLQKELDKLKAKK